MRQEHRAGEKLFVDYSGKKPHIVDPKTGVVIEVELFVAVLGASNYTFVEATLTQRGPDFIASHVRALAFLGGVPVGAVPDQLKSGVVVACRYEPGIQRTYEELGQHYGTAILPARPAHPRDKAKVEVAVLIAQRWILARLRHQTFFSLDALNERIAELLEELNDRRMRVYGASRRELFNRLDQPALKPLPTEPFAYAEWRKVRLNIDYHAEVDHHFYSAPHALVHEQLEARFTAITIELFHRGERVASHLRSYQRGGTRRSTSTCRSRTASTRSGRRHASSAGPRRSGRAQRRSPRRSLRSAAILSRATARASESSGSPSTTARSGSRPRAPAHSRCAPGRTGTSSRSSRTTSTASRSRRNHRRPVHPVDHENIRGGDYYN